MNPDFISIQMTDGELKYSHKKSGLGLTVTTKELIVQKPHVNYYIPLQAILSIVPFEAKGRTLTLSSRSGGRSELTSMSAGLPHYKLSVSGVRLHNRSGIFTMGTVEFIVPLRDELLLTVSRLSGLHAVE
ncbi:hypothetical protein P4H65_13030 [Paenibacillus chitinolyticus]|uniref:hypothetical protein n=1 Tax=Paenibacillus chitinolyticus TaxID=79263 RepID=UPI002DBCB634|nr:hypothetical protein [Paenibacillus chitinolyticus]MEC0246711.1 hypothetical protein [Paenibacillus chitinolyticus]